VPNGQLHAQPPPHRSSILYCTPTSSLRKQYRVPACWYSARKNCGRGMQVPLSAEDSTKCTGELGDILGYRRVLRVLRPMPSSSVTDIAFSYHDQPVEHTASETQLPLHRSQYLFISTNQYERYFNSWTPQYWMQCRTGITNSMRSPQTSQETQIPFAA
jgi:hypothetical protein